MKLIRLMATTILVTVACSTLLWAPVRGADTTHSGWKRSLIADLTATQTAYSDSWNGGEAGSFNWVGNLNGSAEKQLSPTFEYRSTLRLSFGQTMSQNAETKDWSKPVKSTDLIDWENLGRVTAGWLVDPYVGFRLETQFLDAAVEQKKLSLSPLKLTESVGFSRKFLESEDELILTRLGAAIRQTYIKGIVWDYTNTDSFILGTETHSISDGGLESVTDIKLSLGERLKYTGKLTIFKALYSDNDATDDWKAIDLNWENIFNATITKIVTVNFYTQIIYDKEINQKGQFKETLGIGFAFNLI